MERLELTEWGGEVYGLSLRQRLDLRPPSVSYDPRQRRVVIERALERVNEHVVERRLGVLRQSTNEDLDRLHGVELRDAVLGQDVHHARREPTIGNDRDVLGSRPGVELFLFEDDLGVAAEVAEVHT